MADREDRVFCAKLAEQAERYDGVYCCIFGYTDVLGLPNHARPV